MPETKQQDSQGVARPALKPFVRPLTDEPRPSLRPATPAFGRVTLPPFGPIRYGGPKPGATVIAPPREREDDEAPTWASIQEYVHEAPPTEAPEPEPEPVAEEPEPVAAAAEPESVTAAEPEPYVAAEPELPYLAAEPEPEQEAIVASEPELVATEAAPVAGVSETIEDDTGLFDEELPPLPSQAAEPMPWEAAPAPEPEMITRRPVLPLTGPNDPTPIMNPAIERTIERTTERTTERSTEPHRMTPMRVTPLRPSAIAATSIPSDPNARAVAAALEMVAARIRRGDLVVSGSMPTNDDPPALAAVLAATAAALLGVRL